MQPSLYQSVSQECLLRHSERTMSCEVHSILLSGNGDYHPIDDTTAHRHQVPFHAGTPVRYQTIRVLPYLIRR